MNGPHDLWGWSGTILGGLEGSEGASWGPCWVPVGPWGSPRVPGRPWESLEVSLGPLGVRWGSWEGFLGGSLWSLEGSWGLLGGSPNRFVMYTKRNNEVVSAGSVGGRKITKGQQSINSRSKGGAIILVIWAPPSC